MGSLYLYLLTLKDIQPVKIISRGSVLEQMEDDLSRKPAEPDSPGKMAVKLK